MVSVSQPSGALAAFSGPESVSPQVLYAEVFTAGCESLCVLYIWLSFQVLISVLPLHSAKPGLMAPHESSEQSQALVGCLDSIDTTWQVILAALQSHEAQT